MFKKLDSAGNLIVTVAIVAALLVALLTAYQFVKLRQAHSTFDNYYKFRNCTQLIERGSDFGICKTSDGKQIKFVLYKGGWYLEHDLPRCLLGVCF